MNSNFLEKGGGFEKDHGTFSYFICGGGDNFVKIGVGGGLPGKFRKVPWYFFVLSFVEECGLSIPKISICSIKKVPVERNREY